MQTKNSMKLENIIQASGMNGIELRIPSTDGAKSIQAKVGDKKVGRWCIGQTRRKSRMTVGGM